MFDAMSSPKPLLQMSTERAGNLSPAAGDVTVWHGDFAANSAKLGGFGSTWRKKHA